MKYHDLQCRQFNRILFQIFMESIMCLLNNCSTFIFLVLISMGVVFPLYAHPGKDHQEIQPVVQAFFRGLWAKDLKVVESKMIQNFPQVDLNYYQKTLMTSEVDRLSVSKAVYQHQDDGSIVLSPVKHYGSVTDGNIKFKSTEFNNEQTLIMLPGDNRKNINFFSFAIIFKKEKGSWKIAGIKPIQPIKESSKKRQVRPKEIRKIIFTIKDHETGEPIYSRVHIKDAKGAYWPVNGHPKKIRLGSAQDAGGDVQIANKNYAYVKPDFTIDLPDGKYSIEIFHGMEYRPIKQTFTVDKTQVEPLSIGLYRWIDMNKEGWYSGDTHTHFLSEESAFLESQGEGLNIINLLATGWGIYTTKWNKLITDMEKFTGQKSVHSNGHHIVYVNEESRHGFLGHTILHPLKQLITPLSWGGTSRGSEGVPNGFDYPPMAYQADKAHAQGAIVTAAHFPYPPGEIAIDVALDKIDSIDLLTFGDAFYRKTSTFHGLEMPTPAELWYKFLNTGATLPVTAGTDKMRNIQVVGSVRTYVHLEDTKLSYNSWVDGIKKGKTFVTTGPMINLTVDGHVIGSKLQRKKGEEILIKARVRSSKPVREIELISGGKVIAKKENLENRLDLTLNFKTIVKDSTWVAARAYAPEKLDYQRFSLLNTKGISFMAHTSPVYITVGNKPRTSKQDATFLIKLCDVAIKWVVETAKFEKPKHKKEMLKLFKKAKEQYLLQKK